MFRDYGETRHAAARATTSTTRKRRRCYGAPPGTFTALGGPFRATPTCCSTRACTARVVTDKVNVAQHADLKIGVVPVINLEWIQKLHRDKRRAATPRRRSTDTILRRMPDYVNYICPQFTETDINFQRVPTVDTSNPFIARWIPTPDESMVVIRFREPARHRLPLPAVDDPDSFMSRANSIVIPGGKLDLAMQLILTPLILQLVERKRRAS